jgi:hypothetical protein
MVPMTWRRGLSIAIIATCLVPANAWAQLGVGRLELKLTPAMQKYCHIVRFPQGWQIQRFSDIGQPVFFDEGSDLEFRTEGLLGTQFLVGGFKKMVGHRYDTTNRYKVDLSDPGAPLLPATRAAWDAAAVVPLSRKSTFPRGPSPTPEKRAEFHGFQFAKSGDIWLQSFDGATRLSPDQVWLVLQSTTGGANQRGPTRVFLDVFNADTGGKVLTFEGTYSNTIGSSIYSIDPDGYVAQTAWLTERYFIVPLGEHKERCLVCEFGRGVQQPGAKP